MRKPAIKKLIYGTLLTLLVTTTLLLRRAQVKTATPVPFQHVVIDKDAVGAAGQGMDCKAGGDIDGDGFPDIVIGSKELAWYQYPDWAKHVIATAGKEFTTDMQLGDVDGDGDLDAIIPDGEKGKICWFENPRPAGDPAATPWKCHLIGHQDDWVHDVEVGDINGDGRLDVLTRKTKTLLWFQNSLDSWRRVVVETAMKKGEGSALADINKDGRPDIVQNGYWLECPADPTNGRWEKHVVAEGWPTRLGVLVADVNNDGRPDVLMAPAEDHGRLSWYEGPRNPRNGTWAEHVIDDDVDYIHTFRAADANNDGRLDVIAAEMHKSGYHPDRPSRRRVSVYLNDGGGRRWSQEVVARTGSHNIRIADIGADGDIDIFGANWGGPHHPVEMWENKLIDRSKLPMDPSWIYIQVDDTRAKWGDFNSPVWLKYFGLAEGDVTGDGSKDLASGRYFYRNPGGDMTGKWHRVDLGMNVDAMLIVDVDGDGRGDVIAEALPDVFWLKPLDSQGDSWRARRIGSLPPTEHVNGQGYTLAQVVAGGKPEIVLASGEGIFYFEIPANPEQGEWPQTHVTEQTSEEGIAWADVDGDGDIDLGAPGKDQHTVCWFENPGSGGGQWTAHAVGNISEAKDHFADRVAMGDINGDGRPDIIVSEEVSRATQISSVYWFEQPSDPSRASWVRHRLVTQYTTNAMDVGDMDGDGDTDIITGEHRGSRKVAVWENRGHGKSWVEHVVDTGKESHLGARVADLDGDGRLEILSICWDTYPYLHLWRRTAK